MVVKMRTPLATAKTILFTLETSFCISKRCAAVGAKDEMVAFSLTKVVVVTLHLLLKTVHATLLEIFKLYCVHLLVHINT